ncbi:hypothetical protein [Seonamhaeicola sp. ML3]|uniref:hypothetical protein n=1 Tax=Seonamhaeicola sp. ML3 TaxID=2937786 RepID=UPI00200BE426|nr:hypothetical protein [Seonamhaeicola sp. ML3]
MRHIHYKLLVFTITALFSSIVFAQDKLSKDIKKTFPLKSEGALYLENKYGNVFINGWDKASIQLEVSVEVKGKNLDKAKDLLKRINPTFINTNSQLIVKTEIEEKNASVFNKYFKKIGPLNSEKTNSDINYIIYLPKNAAVEITNKYGDVIISDWYGKLNANLEHGDLRITNDLDDSKIAIKYGNLRANVLKNSRIESKNATVSFDESEVLKLESDGSIMTIETVGNLDINSNKDDIEINTVDHIHGTLKYSQMTLNHVGSKVNLNLNLAELRLKKLDAKAPVINLNQKSSEVYVNISETSFNFSAELEQGLLRLPKSMHSINSKVIDEKNKIRQIRAAYGNKNQGIIDITGYKGIIIFKEL